MILASRGRGRERRARLAWSQTSLFKRDLGALRWASRGWVGLSEVEAGLGRVCVAICCRVLGSRRPDEVWDRERRVGVRVPERSVVDGEKEHGGYSEGEGGHEGFAGLEGPCPRSMTGGCVLGLSWPVASLSAALQPGLRGRREAGVSGTVSGEKKQ